MSTETSIKAIMDKFPDTSEKDWRRRAKYVFYKDEARVFENARTKQFCTVYDLGHAIVVKEGNLLPSTDPELMKRLIKAGNSIKHGPDYGSMFWNPTSLTVWMCMADGDCPSEKYDLDEESKMITSYEEVQRILMEAGAKTVLIEAEHSPDWQDAFRREQNPFDSGWSRDSDSSIPESWWNYYHVSVVKGKVVDFN